MDVTPQELRDVEIREAFRGYHRDDVDELLERAASTIEHLEHQIRILQERLASTSARAGAPAVAAAPVAAPAPVPAPAPAAVPAGSGDVIQRTLILAQRAADEALSEAQARAHQLTTEAESRAHAMVSEAETTARRIAETERRRIEAEISQLASTRDALTSDVDALVRFATDYRARVRRAIEAELEHLSQTTGDGIVAPVRPVLRTEGMTFAVEEPEPPALPEPPAALPDPTAPVPVVEYEVETYEEAVVVAEPAELPLEGGWGAEPAGWGEPAPAPAPAPAAPAEPAWAGTAPEAGGAQLDDDAFFASLRDAVRDDEPLGPGEDFFDEGDDEDDDGGRGLFRRRR